MDIPNTVGAGEMTNQEPVERGEKITFQEILMVVELKSLFSAQSKFYTTVCGFAEVPAIAPIHQ